MKRLVALVSVLSVMALASAMPLMVKAFNDTYDVKADSELGKAKCAACHLTIKGGKLNPYGKDLAAVMKAENTKKLTAEILKKVEGLDSDKDGEKNLDELKANKLPGSK